MPNLNVDVWQSRCGEDLFRRATNPLCKTELNIRFMLFPLLLAFVASEPQRHFVNGLYVTVRWLWCDVMVSLWMNGMKLRVVWYRVRGISAAEPVQQTSRGPLWGCRCLHADWPGHTSTYGRHMQRRWSAFTLSTADLQHLSSQNTLVCPRVWNANTG